MARPTIFSEIHDGWEGPGAGDRDMGAITFDGTVVGILLVAGSSGGGVNSATVGGVAMTKISEQASGRRASTWLLTDLSGVDSGDHVVVNIDGGAYIGGASAFALAGSDLIVVDSDAGVGSGTVTLTYANGGYADADLIAFGGGGSNSSISLGSGQSSENSGGFAVNWFDLYRDDVSPTSVSLSSGGDLGHAGVLLAGGLTIEPIVAGASVGIPATYTIDQGDPVIFGPVLGMGAVVGIPAGFRISADGPAQVMLTVPYAEKPQTTEDGTEGYKLTWHAATRPSWEPDTGGDLVSLHIDTSVSGAHTVDRDDGATHDLTLTGDATLTPDATTVTPGDAIDLRVLIRQDGTGGHTLAWGGSIGWVGGAAPTMPTDPAALLTVGLLSVDDAATWLGYVADLAASSDPADDTAAWMPLTSVDGGAPVLVWDDDDSLIPTLVPLE